MLFGTNLGKIGEIFILCPKNCGTLTSQDEVPWFWFLHFWNSQVMGISKWYVTNLSKFFSKINSRAYVTTLLVYLKLPFPALRSISTRREEIYNSTLTLLLSDASWFSQSLNNKKSCRFFNFFSKKVITNQNFEFDDDRGGGVKVCCSDLFCIAWWMFRGSKTSIFLPFHILLFLLILTASIQSLRSLK